MTARIVVTRELPEEVLSPLHELGTVHLPQHDQVLTADELREAVRGADALITTLNDRIDDEVLIAAGPALRVVANTAAGYDNIDLAAVVRHGVVLTHTPGVLVDATADLAFALILDVTRRLSEGDRLVRSGRSWRWDPSFMLGAGLQGRTLGIIGMGSIGRATARRASAFGMEVIHHARRPVEGVDSVGVGLDHLLQTADVVSLHCPLTASTRHLIDAAALSRLKPGAFLINTARGPIVDEAALVDALEKRRLAGAGLDVYEDEPRVHPGLIGLDNVVLAPHLGSATIETRRKMASLAATNVAAVLRGESAPNPVPLAAPC